MITDQSEDTVFFFSNFLRVPSFRRDGSSVRVSAVDDGRGGCTLAEDENSVPMSTLKNQDSEIPLSSQYSHRDADNKMREFEQQRSVDRLAIDLYSPHIHTMIT
ncbi:hypothetical protein QTP88_007380 [Uroleucon formosanum]